MCVIARRRHDTDDLALVVEFEGQLIGVEVDTIEG